ncbi:DoxX family protein [Mycolicibacterium vaccae]|uniref:DoxX family protein n=1 Tax=Mycolicibacterium vaccae TaxID=1810 RepID=UPI003CFCC7FC
MPDVVIWILAALTVTCAAANIAIAVADWGQASFVMANSAEVGVAVGVIPYLAALKMAGALGLLVGFALTPWLGLAAAVGLLLFFVGAVTVHVRTRVLHNIAFPAAYLLLAVAAVAYYGMAVGQ